VALLWLVGLLVFQIFKSVVQENVKTVWVTIREKERRVEADSVSLCICAQWICEFAQIDVLAQKNLHLSFMQGIAIVLHI
jgi:hypothetical protein